MKKEIVFKRINNTNFPNVLFLHGYGQNKEMMMPLVKRADKFANVLAIDLPGSKNNALTCVFTIDDYVEYLEDILNKYEFKPDIIVGHSFGGKLASFYALKYPNIILLLLAPSTIKPSFSLKKFIKIRTYKLFKWLHKHQLVRSIPNCLMGSKDYQNTSGIDRLTFVHIVNSYLNKKQLRKLNNEVYLVYGNRDTEITYKQMKKFARYSPNTHLIVIKGDHFAYIVNVSAVTNLLFEIIKEKSWK
ncbi:MAG: alpha/beta fold hydrolase [Erysipelotrichales bacterium]|nr:alpha/beta fold hydrolase [Erysipelotrichales bacterium]